MTAKKKRRKKRFTTYGKDIKQIYAKFIGTLIPHIQISDSESSIQKAIHSFFLPDTRRVYFGRSKGKFKMPGDKWKTGPHDLLIGTGLRQVWLDDVMVVRLDVMMPNRVDIEFKEQIFTMTFAEYEAISQHIEVVA